MKAVLTLFFVFIFGATALANLKMDVKVDNNKMGFVLDDGSNNIKVASQIEFSADKRVVRLYRLQNARVTKALEFVTTTVSANLA